MKLHSLLSAVLFSALSSSAFAHIYVECGKSTDLENFKTEGFELAISSSGDEFQGQVDGTWSLKLESADADWLKKTDKVIAKTSKDGDATNVEIIIKKAVTPTGPVGTRYIVKDIYSDEPTLERYTMGGFAGTLNTGNFRCISAID